jgi:hypothetical protein
MLIPYHSNRLLPLVVADSASFFYDTKKLIKYNHVRMDIWLSDVVGEREESMFIWKKIFFFQTTVACRHSRAHDL